MGDPKTGKSSLIKCLDPRSKPLREVVTNLSPTSKPDSYALSDNSSSSSSSSNLSNRSPSSGGSNSNGVSSSTPGPDEDTIFSVIEYPSTELDWSVAGDNVTQSSVFLKVWEHFNGIHEEEEAMAFHGALFCIVTVDLRYPESANNAFNSWIPLKTKHMPDAFLFVIGTHVDLAVHRRVDITEICKACSQKDAIYLEVSSFDGTNLQLLRRLVSQRISYMLKVRQMLRVNSEQSPPTALLTAASITTPLVIGTNVNADGVITTQTDVTTNKTTEGDNNENNTNINNNNSSSELNPDGKSDVNSMLNRINSMEMLHTPFLDQDIVCDSVGSILASSLGIEYWPGFEVEEQNLIHIGESISELVDRIAADPKSLPEMPLEFKLQTSFDPAMFMAASELRPPEIGEIKQVFDILGLSMPFSLLHTQTTPSSAVLNDESVNLQRGHDVLSAKLKVRLPDGSKAEMTVYDGYDVNQQVDAFMIQYNIDDHWAARDRLVECVTKTLEALHDNVNPLRTTHPVHHQAYHHSRPGAPPDAFAGRQLVGGGGLASTSPAVNNASSPRNGNAQDNNNKEKETPERRGTIHHNIPSHPHLMKYREPMNAAPQPQSAPKGPTRKKYKVKIKLPNSIIESIIREGDDVAEIAREIAHQNHLSPIYETKIMAQLQSVLVASVANKR